jgi:hypothetical protein
MMVIFLVGLVSMILLRTVRKDYARYSQDEEVDAMVNNIFYLNFHFVPFIILFIDRTKIWAMSMVGNKFMVMYSVQHLILCFSLQLLDVVTT